MGKNEKFLLIYCYETGLWNLQWVETNQSNFRIYPADIRLLPPHGTMLTAYADVRTDVGRC